MSDRPDLPLSPEETADLVERVKRGDRAALDRLLAATPTAAAKGDPRQDARKEPGRSEGPGEERHSGQGSESALRQLRAWERRRASDRTAPVRDKPGA